MQFAKAAGILKGHRRKASARIPNIASSRESVFFASFSWCLPPPLGGLGGSRPAIFLPLNEGKVGDDIKSGSAPLQIKAKSSLGLLFYYRATRICHQKKTKQDVQ